MAESNEAKYKKAEHFEQQSIDSSVDSPEKTNSQAKILDYYQPKMMKSDPSLVLQRTVTAKSDCSMQSFLDDVCNELDSIDIIVSKNKIIECYRPPEKSVENDVDKVNSSIPKCIRDTLSKKDTEKQSKNPDVPNELAVSRPTAVGHSDKSNAHSMSGQVVLSTHRIQKPKIHLKSTVDTSDIEGVLTSQASDIEQSFLMNAQSSSSFNVTDSVDDAVDLQQSISIEVITEGIDDLDELSNQYEDDVPIHVNSFPNSSKKNAMKKGTYTKSSHKSTENRTMKARRISAKMKTLWAKEQKETGYLTCPMPGCNKTYVSFTNFQTHYKWCTGEKTLQHCPFCESLIFSGPESVLHHMEVEHPEKVDEYREKLGVDQSRQHVQLATSSVIPPKSIFKRNGKKYQRLKKGRIFTSKENIFSGNKDLDFELKNIERTMTENLNEFQKCVKFNDIVQKINSVGGQSDFDELETGLSTRKAPILAKKFKEKRFAPFDGNSDETAGYFADESGNVDCPSHMEEDDEDCPPKRVTTKSRVVLNTRGYERFSQYLKLTRDWASERQTYTRSKNPVDSMNMSVDETLLPPDVQDSYLLAREPTESFGMSLSSLDSSQIATPQPLKKSIKDEPDKNTPAKSAPAKPRRIEREIVQPVNSISSEVSDAAAPKDLNTLPIQENQTPEIQDMNYGHLLFSKPNKKIIRKERTTCYDNAANLDTEHKHSSNHLSSFNKYVYDAKRPDMIGRSENPPLPVVDFDTLLGTSTPCARGRPRKKIPTQPGELANGMSPINQNNVNPLKGGKTVLQKYSREDGVKLPGSLKKYQRDKKLNAHTLLSSKELLNTEGSHLNGRIDGTSLFSSRETDASSSLPSLKSLTLDFIIKEVMSSSTDKLPLFIEPFGGEYACHAIFNAVHSAASTDFSRLPPADYFITNRPNGQEFLCYRFKHLYDNSSANKPRHFEYIHDLCESEINHIIDEVSLIHDEPSCIKGEMSNKLATRLRSKSIVPIGLTASNCYSSWTLCVLLPELDSDSCKCYSVQRKTSALTISKRGRPPKMVMELKSILQTDISVSEKQESISLQSVEGTDTLKKGKKSKGKKSEENQGKLAIEQSSSKLSEDLSEQNASPVEETSNNILPADKDCNATNILMTGNSIVSPGGVEVNENNVSENQTSDMSGIAPEAPPKRKRGRPPGSKKKTSLSVKPSKAALDINDVHTGDAENAHSDSEDLLKKLVLEDTFKSEVDCVLETVRNILSAANESPSLAVRKSTRVRKRKIHPDEVIEQPKKKHRKLSDDVFQKEQEESSVERNIITKRKRKIESMDENEANLSMDKPKYKKAKIDAELENLTVAKETSTKGKMVNSKNLSPKKGQTEEDTKMIRSRKSQPRKCVRYVEINNSSIGNLYDPEDKISAQDEPVVPEDCTADEYNKESNTEEIDAEALSDCTPLKKATTAGWKTSKRIMKRYFEKNAVGKNSRKPPNSEISNNDLNKETKVDSTNKTKTKKTPAYLKKARMKAVPLRKVLLQNKYVQKKLAERRKAESEIHGDISAINEMPRAKRMSAIRAQKILSSLEEDDLRIDSTKKSEKEDDETYVPPEEPCTEKTLIDVGEELQKLKKYYTIPKVKKSTPPSKKLLASWTDKIESNGSVTCDRENCGKVFSTKGGMIYHFQYSCVQHRWRCDVCNKSVVPQAEKMLSHLKNNHKAVIYPSDKPKRRETSSLQDIYTKIELPTYEVHDLFPELRPKRTVWEKIDSSLLENLPPAIKSSLKFNLCSFKNDVGVQSYSLPSFTTCEKDGGMDRSTFYTGGPIWYSAWCPTSGNKDRNQYVMLVAGFATETEPSTSPLLKCKSLLQLWDFGNLNDSVIKVQPSLKIAIPLDCGKVSQLSWCPDCWENPSKASEENLPRLGVVALACADSYIRIFSIPHPDSLSSSSEDVPLYNVQPMVLLRPLSGGPSSCTELSMCITLSWQRSNSKNRSIAGGYSNGLVFFWRIPQNPGLLLERTDAQDIISPYNTLQAHGAGITCIEFSPYSEGRYLATSSIDKNLRIWDLQESYNGMPLFNMKKGIIKAIQWPSCWGGIFLCFDDGLVSTKVTSCYQDFLLKKNRTMSFTDTSGMSLSVSSHMCMVAIGDYAGELTVNSLQKLYLDYPRSYTQCQFSIFKTVVRALPEKLPIVVEKDSPSDSSAEKKSEEDAVPVTTTSTDDVPLKNESCADSKQPHGLLFIDLQTEATKSSEKIQKRLHSLTADSADPMTFDSFYPASVNSVCWNPNLGSHQWLFSANQSGIGRVFYIPEQKTKRS